MSYTLIDSDAALDEVLVALRDAGDLAVDTEFMRRDTYYPQVALLQLCAGYEAWLIDPLAITQLDGLRELLVDHSVLKVLHSCSEDLEVFRCWLGVLPTPLVDTQRAAALLGEDFGLGYRALVSALLDIDLEKGETRSDWLQRPLTASQSHYAAQDVIQLLPAWKVLRARAEAQGRMPWLLEEGAEACAALTERERDIHLRVKGAGRLAPRELEVLRRLCLWREERAQRLDRPRGWVLSDKACLAIARGRPRRREALGDLDVLPPAVLRRHADALLVCVEEALAVPHEALPAPPTPGLTPAQRECLKTLRDAVRERASHLGVAPEAALTGSELELLVREASGETIVAPARWSGWRGDTIVAPLRALLAGMQSG